MRKNHDVLIHGAMRMLNSVFVDGMICDRVASFVRYFDSDDFRTVPIGVRTRWSNPHQDTFGQDCALISTSLAHENLRFWIGACMCARGEALTACRLLASR